MSSYNTPSDYEVLLKRAKELRLNPTPAEKKLWNILKNGLEGYDFLNQVVMVPFIPDFVCLSAKLIIEVDGDIHELQQNYDFMRDQHLAISDFKVIRFTNKQIFEESPKVLKAILDECQLRDPLPLGIKSLLNLKAKLLGKELDKNSKVTHNQDDTSRVFCSKCFEQILRAEPRIKDHINNGWLHKKCKGFPEKN